MKTVNPDRLCNLATEHERVYWAVPEDKLASVEDVRKVLVRRDCHIAHSNLAKILHHLNRRELLVKSYTSANGRGVDAFKRIPVRTLTLGPVVVVREAMKTQSTIERLAKKPDPAPAPARSTDDVLIDALAQIEVMQKEIVKATVTHCKKLEACITAISAQCAGDKERTKDLEELQAVLARLAK